MCPSSRCISMSSVVVNVPVTGSYSSALPPEWTHSLPAINTLPSGSRVAVLYPRGVVIFPVAVDVPAEGSYTSAKSLASQEYCAVTRTLPFVSKLAVTGNRSGYAFSPVGLKVPVSGS